MRVAALCLLVALPVSADDLICIPDHPVFCTNLHVGCAGRSAVQTQRFRVEIGQDSARIHIGSTIALAEVTRSHSGAVFREKGKQGWLRIDPSLRFSQRIYRDKPLMSIGTCMRQVPEATR